jgi:hypothetical protein
MCSMDLSTESLWDNVYDIKKLQEAQLQGVSGLQQLEVITVQIIFHGRVRVM